MDTNVYAQLNNNSHYSVDLVLSETHNIIEHLKQQLEVESGKLNHLEATLADNNNYPAPAWFNNV